MVLLAPCAWAQAALQITTTSVPNGKVGVGYSATVSSNANPDLNPMWSVSGSLPPGLSLTNTTGASTTIAGTPSSPGTFSFTLTVQEEVFTAEVPPASQGFTITIISPLVFDTTSPLPTGVVGVSYSTQLFASGGTPPYTFSSSNVPPGLQVTANGGVVGVPTAANNYTLSVTVTDSVQTMTVGNFAIVIAPPLTFLTGSPLPQGTAGLPYSQTISANGGTPPYSFSITGTSPPGVGLTSSGVFSGTPTSIGTFSFNVQVTDSLKFTAEKQYSVTFSAGTPLLQVTPLSLAFNAAAGSAPLPQAISILSSSATATAFSIAVDSGTAGGTQPPWITVGPINGNTPQQVFVSVNPAMLTGASGTAVLHVSVPNNTTQAVINVTVTLNVSSATPAPQAVPGSLQFALRSDAPGIEQQTIFLANLPASQYKASIAGNSPWLSLPAVAGLGASALAVQINSTGLAVGNYHDIVQITAGSASIDVPVSLFVEQSGPILGLGLTGVRFEARQGNVPMRPQMIPILNLGDPSSTVSWTADLLSGSNWLSISNSSGTATVSNPGELTITPTAGADSLAAGPQYALIGISAPNVPNSPLYITAILDNQPVSAPPLPDPSTAGLYFNSTTAPQPVLLYTSSATPIAFQASASTTDGSAWLAVKPSSGVASTSSPGQLSVSVTPPAAAGIYTGSVNIGMSGFLVVLNVTLVVPGGSAVPLSAAVHPLATGSCTPSKLAMTETGLVNNFSVPAGWPATLIVQLNDDCGNAVSNGAVVASFSNGDAPLPLPNDQSNTYSATWQPGVVFPEMSIVLNATSPTLAPVTQMLTGNVNTNPTPPPVLLPGGTLQIFFNGATAAALGNGLAPGNVAQVYGSGLGPTSIVGATSVPLPTQLDGTFMLVGGVQAPLYFVLNSPIAIQIPFELATNQQAAAIASVNGALSLPIMLNIVPVQPGIALNPDGSVNAQHLDATYSSITASNPAKPGETIVIYLAGMGATNPSVPTGAATPAELVPTTVQPTVTVDSQNAEIVYAGLTPTGVGLYQIDFTVPSNARSGSLNVVVTQNGVSSNTGTLPVSQ